MPSLKLFCNVSIRPFAGDDIHPLCIMLGFYRLAIFGCAITISVYIYQQKTTHDSIMCGDVGDTDQDGPVVIEQKTSADGMRQIMTSAYCFLLLILIVSDLAVLASIYSAASIGTPTQTLERDKFLRPLLQFKIFGLNILMIVLVVCEMVFIQLNRDDNWGCDEGEPTFEDSPWYKLFAAILFLLGLELMLIPCLTTINIVSYIQRLDPLKDKHFTVAHERVCYEACCGGCLKFCGLFCCCNKAGGREISLHRGDMKDIILALLDFFTYQDIMDVVFSDLYVGLKTLALVQRERQVDCIKQATHATELASALEEGMADVSSVNVVEFDTPVQLGAVSLFVGRIPEVEEEDDIFEEEDDLVVETDQFEGVRKIDRRLEFQQHALGRSMWNFKRKKGGKYELKLRSLIANDNDKHLIQEAAHFARYAEAIYGATIYQASKAYIVGRSNDVFHCLGSEENISLSSIGYTHTDLVYANFRNGYAETPYCILVDHEKKTVVVTIRGTASLEDMIVDLQLTPACLFTIGEKCGFDGSGEFCHKGVLTRSTWIYDDIARNNVLDNIFAGDNPPYPEYELLITGHSLGAGCATIVSIMFRAKYPSLRCFAFCPPGGLLSEGLAVECKSYVTSFVNDSDIIPRTSLDNLEKLRDDSLELLARIKVPKIQVYRTLKTSCDDRDLAAQNAKLLYPKAEIPKNTEFFAQLQAFRARNQRISSRLVDGNPRVRLYPPGDIIHMVKTTTVDHNNCTKTEYLAQWADKDDFNEIILCSTLFGDHSIDNVIMNLESICSSFMKKPGTAGEKAKKYILKSLGMSTDDDKDRNTQNNLVPTLICWSKPYGNMPIRAAMIGTLALFLASFSNNYCDLVQRGTLVYGENTPPQKGLTLSAGLYTNKDVVYLGGNMTDLSNYEEETFCSNFPDYVPIDSHLRAARGCSVAALTIGVMAVTSLWFTACVSYRRCTWRLINVAFMATTLLEGLIFLIFRSEFCNVLHFPGNNVFGPLTIESDCDLGTGGVIGIVSIILFFVCAVLTIQYPSVITRNIEEGVVEEQHSLDHIENNTVVMQDLEEEEDKEDSNGNHTFINVLSCLCFLGYKGCCTGLCFSGLAIFLLGIILLVHFVEDKRTF